MPGGLAAPAVDLDDAVGDVTASFVDALWERWPCEDDDCPARPGWDVALSEAENAMRIRLGHDLERMVRRRLAAFAERFQAEHPEAVLRPPA